MATNPAAAAFAHRLDRLMRVRGFESKRAFGKLIDPDDPERGRRRLQRHLSGKHMPSPASVRVYADALGVPVKELDPDADEEGAQTVKRHLAVELRELVRAVKRLEQRVAAENTA